MTLLGTLVLTFALCIQYIFDRCICMSIRRPRRKPLRVFAFFFENYLTDRPLGAYYKTENE